MKVYPIPFTDVLNVEATTGLNAQVHIMLYDSNGKIVMQTEKEICPAGNFQKQINTSGLVAGSYLICVHANEKIFVSTIIKK